MKKKSFKVKIRNCATIILISSLILSGCGNKGQSFDVDYYGGSEGSETSDATGDEVTENEYGENHEGISEGGNLAERLGGKEVTFKDTINVNGAVINFDLKYKPDETVDRIPTFKGHPIGKSDVKEDEIVKNLFGDTAVALSDSNERKLDQNAGDSINLINALGNLLYHFNNDSEYINYSSVSSWYDKNEYYIHCYEGEYNGKDYQFAIGFCESYGEMAIGLFPKNPGQLIDDPSYNFMFYGSTDDVVQVQTEDGKTEFIHMTDIIGSGENECQKSEDELIQMADDTLKNKMNIHLPEGALSFEASPYVTASGAHIATGDNIRLEVFYMDDTGDYSKMKRNGYTMMMESAVNGIQLMRGLDNIDLVYDGDFSYGLVMVNDSGIIGLELPISYNVDGTITEDSTLLSFDSAMEAMETAIEKECDLKGNTKCTFDYVELNYFPVKSPDDPNEYTFVPAWVAYGSYHGPIMGRVVINAIDGSLMQCIFK